MRTLRHTQLRHAEHYKNVLSAANTSYLRGGDEVLRGLKLFDLERTNIEAGQAWAAEYAIADDTAAELCNNFPRAGVCVLDLRQHPRESIHWREAALVAARQLKRPEAESVHLGNLGAAYDSLGENRRAIEYYEQALAIARAMSATSRGEVERMTARRSEGAFLGNLGNVYFDLGEYRHAIEYHEQALAIFREINAASRREAERTAARLGEGQVLGNLGVAYYSLGEHHRAIEYQEQRLTIAREIGDRLGEGGALGNMGAAYLSLGEHHRAIEYQEQRLTIAREIGDRLGEGAALGNMGAAYHSLGEYRRAIEYHVQDLAIAREIGDRRGEGIALVSLGNAYNSLGETRHATEYHEQALAVAREIGDRYVEANSLWGLAICYEAVNDRPQAIAYAQAALDIFTAIETPEAQEVRDLLEKWHE